MAEKVGGFDRQAVADLAAPVKARKVKLDRATLAVSQAAKALEQAEEARANALRALEHQQAQVKIHEAAVAAKATELQQAMDAAKGGDS